MTSRASLHALVSGLALGLGLVLAFAPLDRADLFLGFLGLRRPPVAGAMLGIAAVLALVAFRREHRRRARAVPALLVLAALTAGASLWTMRTPYRTETVSYRSGDVSLAATLYLPKDAPGRRPAVVVVQGSEPIRRTFYHLWADRIARRGLAVLLADKRGVGDSGGEFVTGDGKSASTNVAMLASDVAAGVHFLARRPEIDPERIGLFGISQAGWVAPEAARRSPVKFMALVTAPAVSTHEEGVWSDLRGDHDGEARASRAAAEAILDTVTPGGVDAREMLGALTIPSLWLFGDEDASVPTRRSVAALEALERAGRPVEWRVFEGYDHGLVARTGGPLARIAPASWPVLLEWLDRRSGGATDTIQRR